jgi:heterodisulfide reductase subunit D
MANYFEDALSGRIDEMLDACTRCGKCIEACPVKTPAGVVADPESVIAGVIDILRGGDGTADSRRWASTCMLTGDCIKACEEGVNPRFLLAMARLAMAKDRAEPRERRREGVEGFRKLNLDVTVQSRMQVEDDVLARLGQKVSAGGAGDAVPDFVFYTGCNLLKTPHIALLALDIMDALGVTYKVMGGPTHCCGVIQLRTGDTDVSANMAANTMGKLAQAGQVLSWCPSCHVQFTEVMMPAHERSTGSRPFEMTPFMRFLGSRVDDLKPLLRHSVRMRIALHKHPGIPGVVEAALRLLAAVPGVQVVDLGLPAVGLMSNALRTLPDYKRQLQLRELEAAREAGVDALVAVYHADHRELCAHERDWPFVVINLLEVIGASMGIVHPDKYKKLKILQDIDLIVAECQDLLTRHGIRDDLARQSIKAMLEDQPLPLQRP